MGVHMLNNKKHGINPFFFFFFEQGGGQGEEGGQGVF